MVTAIYLQNSFAFTVESTQLIGQVACALVCEPYSCNTLFNVKQLDC